MSINKIYITAFVFSVFYNVVYAQELYVLNDPASNVPGKSLNLKYAGNMSTNHLTDTNTWAQDKCLKQEWD